MITVAVCGYFDPLHPGHVSHIEEASKLGDRLVVITHPDHIVAQKRIKLIGKPLVHQPLAERMARIMELPGVTEVVVSIDTDGSVAKTLEWLKPDILAKGGDRSPANLPEVELAVCKRIGCRIVSDIGAAKRPEWSSTQIAVKSLA